MEQGRIDQYKKETSQIHAPEDLIRRTKETVCGEEERIAREKAPQKTAAKKKRYGGRAYRWALPAAAAVLVIVAGTSGIFFGRGADKFMSESALDMAANDTSADDTSAESNMELQLGVSSGADADGAEPIGRGGSNGMTEDAAVAKMPDTAVKEAATAEMSDAIAEDTADAGMPEAADAEVSNAATEDAAVAKMPDTAVKEAATAEMSDAIAEDTADTGISEAAAEDTADAEMSDTATDNTAAAVNGAYNSIAETGPDTAAADAVQSDDIYSSLKELADTVYRLLVQTIR